MLMSDSEIRKMYQESKDPKKQIRILAELNDVSICTIEKKLKEFGIYQGGDYEPLFDVGEALRLFEDGFSDKEIAAKLHIRLQTFCDWKRAQGLVRDRKKRRFSRPKTESTNEKQTGASAQIPAGLLSKALLMFPDSVQPVLNFGTTSENVRSIYVSVEVVEGKVISGIIEIR